MQTGQLYDQRSDGRAVLRSINKSAALAVAGRPWSQDGEEPQAVEHYELARYGLLKTWARQLGLEDAVVLLDATLQEEKKANELLPQIALNENAKETRFRLREPPNAPNERLSRAAS
jgi:Domain of unknown function (DUF892)